ncbi:2-oxo acid dehydrogenase subunit E2 [Marinomonas algicola]|uniref:2-oxo acid dehydrogenase subunit E2 n=1 Tax=Marinomonas algicola TaxID=2773454 RepID=UPI001749922C|nr:2-oxo acid dehydrogenase subunit E2 [Marinomonas algicola]
MKIDFILPDIGEGIVECELVEWQITEGQEIKEDQSVADVMTDKALVEITSMYTGRISKLYYAKGEIAKVHQPLFEIEVADDKEEEQSETSQQNYALTDTVKATQWEATPDEPSSASSNNGKAVASPAVRRLARECGVDIHQITGSGKNGRVYKEDIEQHQSLPDSILSDIAKPIQEAIPLSVVAGANQNRVEPITGIKAIMAKQMLDSVKRIPHFTYAEELDVTHLEEFRAQLKPEFAAQGAKLSMMPFIMKALALTLPEFPILNSRVNEDCTEITYLYDINIGMAADTPLGLLVPNVKKVQTLSLLEVALEVNRLAEAARSGKLKPDEMKGASISVSNIGVIGGTVATPIINPPEVAIMAMGRIQTQPRFNDKGEVEARKIMHVSWSGDHRIIDGATMARFCNKWKSYVENPISMLTQLR